MSGRGWFLLVTYALIVIGLTARGFVINLESRFGDYPMPSGEYTLTCFLAGGQVVHMFNASNFVVRNGSFYVQMTDGGMAVTNVECIAIPADAGDPEPKPDVPDVPDFKNVEPKDPNGPSPAF